MQKATRLESNAASVCDIYTRSGTLSGSALAGQVHAQSRKRQKTVAVATVF
jgi:hypothetical protein